MAFVAARSSTQAYLSLPKPLCHFCYQETDNSASSYALVPLTHTTAKDPPSKQPYHSTPSLENADFYLMELRCLCAARVLPLQAHVPLCPNSTRFLVQVSTKGVKDMSGDCTKFCPPLELMQPMNPQNLYK